MNARRKYLHLSALAATSLLGSLGVGFGALWWWAIRDIDRKIGAACVVTAIALAIAAFIAWAYADLEGGAR